MLAGVQCRIKDWDMKSWVHPPTGTTLLYDWNALATLPIVCPVTHRKASFSLLPGEEDKKNRRVPL
jgi:hypothetical protein